MDWRKADWEIELEVDPLPTESLDLLRGSGGLCISECFLDVSSNSRGLSLKSNKLISFITVLK